jgi:hypothetical protein
MGDAPVWSLLAQNCGIVQKRHAACEKRHSLKAAVAFVMALSQTFGQPAGTGRRV